MSEFKNIPTNIISGFLGAGKTTVIQYLLKHKPASEVWAVIVNEFGQVGIDGALLENSHVEIKQIPGGCLCCVGSQALSVGLNQIIRSVKPQRILIEPTGLGHPAKLISTLSGEFYKNVLDLKAVINLIDAKNLNDTRYLNNETFVEQSNLANILIATKLDTYSEDDKNCFFDYAMGFVPEKLEVAMIEQGKLNLLWLDVCRLESKPEESRLEENKPEESKSEESKSEESKSEESKREEKNTLDTSHSQHKPVINTNHQQSDWLMLEGQGDGYFSLGWKLNGSIIFERQKLIEFIDSLFSASKIERLKAVLNTDEGWLLLNITRNERNMQDTDARADSTLEIISTGLLDAMELNLTLHSCKN